MNNWCPRCNREDVERAPGGRICIDCKRANHALWKYWRSVLAQPRGIPANRKLQPSDVIAIRARRADGISDRALAREFRMSRRTIWDIVNNRTWRHLEDAA